MDAKELQAFFHGDICAGARISPQNDPVLTPKKAFKVLS
jgi:hypothetical protein